MIAVRPYRCARCGSTWAADATRWRCDCGGLLTLEEGDALPRPSAATAEAEIVVGGRRLGAKVEYDGPTGSFKDRGAGVLVDVAAAVGAEQLVADSSGNAGKAVAAAAASAGLRLRLFVPASTPAAKVAVAAAHGADVVRVDGSREDTAVAAIAEVEATGAFFASHVYNPWFWEGTASIVDELDPLPDTLLLPVGNGTLVLGALVALRRRGAVGRCRIVAVRAALPTVAEGIAIASPPRWPEVVAAVDATGGRIVTVGDDEIVAAQQALREQGHTVEPTAAAAPAAAHHLGDDDGDVVVPLTGRG